MKVTIKYKGTSVNDKKQKLLNFYIKFLFKKLPLKQDISIDFVSEREGKMTTGSRRNDNKILVLTKGRILRDILRTLGHEWVHEYQMSVLGRKRGPDIGGKNENEANSLSAQFIKMFEKKYPGIIDSLYE
jgi:hypothetical protein